MPEGVVVLSATSLPTVIIGAGPVGLTAAAHLVRRGLTPLVLEASDRDGGNLRDWGHVRLFTPWEYATDPVAEDLLRENGWTQPDPEAFPTGQELADGYTAPLVALPALRGRVRFGTRVVAVTRRGVDKLKDAGRDEAPFEVIVQTARGHERLLASAVIDASGTWQTPNPLGSGGVPAAGERELADKLAYRIPDVLARDRDRYAGKRVLVAGAGHSAFTALNDLAQLRADEPTTEIVWAIRRPSLGTTLGGGEDDELAERGALGTAVGRLVDAGAIELVTGFETLSLQAQDGRVVLGDGDRALVADEVIVTTGFRPDLSILGELRLDLDDRVEAARALAPMIDPNLHSCGSVPPHGVDELSHPEKDVFVVGMKSYGRAPTFLLRTGYEQVRSVVAALAGDWTAARNVELVLPETGVCCVPQQLETTPEPTATTTPVLEMAAAPAAGCCTPTPAAEVPSAAASGCCGSSASESVREREATPAG
jgi:thioredoxin reductase